MAADIRRSWASEDRVFAVLRTLAMLGGMIALFLVPLHPEHQPHVAPLAWAFVGYKAFLFLAIRMWPARLRLILLGTTAIDLAFVALFVWHSGGGESHFYLLFYLLVALAAAHFGPAIGLATAGTGSMLYVLASLVGVPSTDWNHLSARVATFFLLGGALGYLSQRERLARAEAERLNENLRRNQERLEKAYEELQAAQERAVRSERLAVIGQMSAKVSHEVRNPLSSISLNMELLEDELQGTPQERQAEIARLLTAIRSQVDLLSAVTEEYLHFARLPKPKLEPTPVASLVEELVAFVRGELQAKRVELAVRMPQDLPPVPLDPGQIRQVLLNLIRNAAEAMPGGGTIRIAARSVDSSTGQPVTSEPQSDQSRNRRIDGSSFVEIEVLDTGPGVPAEDRERIFEPFFTTKEGGTGLGLAIARQIAQDHGGSLTCENSPGGGATFHLILPVRNGGRAS